MRNLVRRPLVVLAFAIAGGLAACNPSPDTEPANEGNEVFEDVDAPDDERPREEEVPLDDETSLLDEEAVDEEA